MAVLFITFAVSMGIGTFIENDYNTQTARALVYSTWWFELIMLLFMVNFIGNIKKYNLIGKKKWSVLCFHLSFVFIIIGAGITRYISHEGVMPIKEGETTSAYFSEANYISITIDDGEVQKTPIHKKVLLSAKGNNGFVVKTKFKGDDIKIALTDYIANSKIAYQQDDNGDNFIHFVESSSGSRHDHYIKEGEVTNIHGVNVGFNNDENVAVYFELKNDELKIRTTRSGTFMRMADQKESDFKADSLQVFNYRHLYSIAEMQFVVPELVERGVLANISADAKENPLDYLEFTVEANGESKKIVLYGAQYNIEKPTILQVGKYTFRLHYGARELKLPFEIQLVDFQLDKYPGSDSPMSYASEVILKDKGKEDMPFRIFMNNILDYKGYKFFQSSYDIDGEIEETRLSVNHDYWGTLVTYIGYALLFLGLILILFSKNTRFHELKKSLAKIADKKKLMSVAILLFTVFSYSQHSTGHNSNVISDNVIDSILQANKVDKIHAERFSKLIIQDISGRMKPINTFASQLLRKVSKKDVYKGLDANQVFVSILENPKFWWEVPVVYLERGNDKIRTILGIDIKTKKARLRDFIDPKGNYKIHDLVGEAHKKQVRSKFEKDIINIDARVNLLYSALVGSVMRIYPLPDDKTNKWISPLELGMANYKGIDSVFVKQILPAYIQTLQEAKKTKDYTEVNKILDGIVNFQKKYGAAVYPEQKQIDLEIAYNKYDVFKKLFKYYMYIGLLMMILSIWGIFKTNKILNLTVKIGSLITVVLFTVHTLGLAARWYISGHAPWSNAYESMIYVAWATMLFGLVLGRKSTLTLSATTFLTSMILMIAHWNWMDPEIANIQPVLNSYWLMVHVSIIVASYGPLALSMILGIVSLVLISFTNKNNKKKLSLNIKELTIINEMSMVVGLIMLAIGNFLGGMWANESWGRYWGWDPKETWALISIMIYSLILHFRLIPGLKSKFAFNLASVIGFASIMMTYFGVNFYLSGLHSYASGDKIVTPNFIYYSIGIVFVLAVLAYLKHNKYYKK